MKRIDSYLVVGTGRSGTSTVARVMHEKLGISMGNEFVPSNEFNEKGYYEDVDFYRANLAFYDNQLFFGDWVCQIREILRERYKAGKPWGFKDSRMASLLGAYFTFLNEPKVIRCKRDSELVIASMIRCYGWSESKAKSVCESRETALDRVLVGRNQKDILTIHFGENHLPDEMIAKLIQKKWQKPIRLYVAILNKGWLRREITQRVLPQIKNTHGVEVYVEPFSLTWANPICSNRAKIMMRFLTHYPKQDFLLTMDDDCVPYFNPAKFVFSDKDVIGFPAPVRSTGQHLVWTAYTKHAERDGFVPVDFAAVDDNIDLLGVDVLGTGAIMIKRNVLEKLKHKQPFATPFDKYGQSKYGTDFAFCMKARKAGFEVFTAPNHFVEHFKEVPLLDLTGYDYPENFDLSNSKYKSPWGEWSITQKDWKFIKGTIKSEFGDKKIKILEFGCGLSSLLMSEKHKVISYEMDKEYADVVREKMTPDNDLEIRFWDGAEIKEKLGKFDLVFVDGPLGKGGGGVGRENSIRIASEVSDRIIVHDAGRNDEAFWQRVHIKGPFRRVSRSGLHQTRCNFWKRRCMQCGKCCILAASPGRYVLLTEDEAKSGKYKTRNHPDLNEKRSLARKKIYYKELDREVWTCYHFDEETMKCSIYDDRPFDCRRYYCYLHAFDERWEIMKKKYKKKK